MSLLVYPYNLTNASFKAGWRSIISSRFILSSALLNCNFSEHIFTHRDSTALMDSFIEFL